MVVDCLHNGSIMVLRWIDGRRTTTRWIIGDFILVPLWLSCASMVATEQPHGFYAAAPNQIYSVSALSQWRLHVCAVVAPLLLCGSSALDP